MKIIEEGNFPRVTVRCNFDRCNAKVLVGPEDLMPPTKSPLKKFFFRCPICGLKSEIPSEKISAYFESTYEMLNKKLEEESYSQI